MIHCINHTSFSLKGEVFLPEVKKLIVIAEKLYSKKYHEINIAFFTKEEIKQLNNRFLKENKETDVLSFKDFEQKANEVNGDIAICPKIVFENAVQDKMPLNYALMDAILHGILHLFGLNHDYSKASLEKVYVLQKNIFNKISINFKVFDEVSKQFLANK